MAYVISDDCIACGTCIEMCTDCGTCADACPTEAIHPAE